MESLGMIFGVIATVGVMQLIVFVALHWLFAASDDVPPHFYRTENAGSKDCGQCRNCPCGKTVTASEGSV